MSTATPSVNNNIVNDNMGDVSQWSMEMNMKYLGEIGQDWDPEDGSALLGSNTTAVMDVSEEGQNPNAGLNNIANNNMGNISQWSTELNMKYLGEIGQDWDPEGNNTIWHSADTMSLLKN